MTELAQKVNITQARINMISQQIRTNGVEADNILAVLAEIPRELFVPMEYRALAYSDTQLPIGHHQTMLTPLLEAQILQYSNLSKTDTVLEIGTGSGYLTALLARLTHYVYSVDKYSDFTHNAAKKLAQLKIDNVLLETGNAATGWFLHEPYDVIIVTGSLAALDQRLLQQLTVGGRLFAVVGEPPCQTAMRVIRMASNEWQQQKLFETVIPPLEEVAVEEQFVF